MPLTDEQTRELHREISLLLHDSHYETNAQGHDWDVADVLAAIWPTIAQATRAA